MIAEKNILISLAITAFALPSAMALPQKGDDLDARVVSIIEKKCVMCHDARPGDSGSDVEKLLDLDWLADPSQGYFSDTPAESYLAELIENGDMPKEDWKGISWAGPLTDAEKSTLTEWINRGGPSATYRRTAAAKKETLQRQSITDRQIVSAIANDLKTLSGVELKNARYLTLSNLHNRSSVSEEQLELYRQGMVKMLNSLSRSSDILGMPGSAAPHKIVAVDEAATTFRFDLRHIGWEKNDWEKVVDHYPYGLLFNDGLGQSVTSLTDSEFPYMRADWFVFATSQAPLYHELVGIDKLLVDLENKLGIDRLSNIKSFRVARAGFGNSRVSVNNRLIERHSFRGGYYYISYDFFKNSGKANFFDFPLGPVGVFDSKFAFEHDGGEVIYTLPNGFQAYVLVTASGKRISIAPASVVHDDSMSQIGSVILNGISCISCHYDGMKPENPARLADLDEVRERSLKDFRTFSAKDRSLIEQLYPPHDEFRQLIVSDRTSWRAALQEAGITKRGVTEPVRALFDTFARNLNLEVAAAEFGLTSENFLERMQQENETRQLSLRLEKEGMQRQLFVEEFRLVAELTGLGTPKGFKPLLVPYFGHNPDQAKESSDDSTPATATQSQAVPESEVISANNQPAEFKLSVENVDDRKSFNDGEAIPVSIRASQDCFLTALAIDPKGQVTSLIPNKVHNETDGTFVWSPMKLRANRTLKITVDTVGFEFFAQAPHGPTKIRVIVTKDKLLKLRFNNKMMRDLSSKGTPSLGYSKGAGVRFGEKPTVSNPADAAPVPQDLTEKRLNELFPANDWATAEWTFITRAK